MLKLAKSPQNAFAKHWWEKMGEELEEELSRDPQAADKMIGRIILSARLRVSGWSE